METFVIIVLGIMMVAACIAAMLARLESERIQGELDEMKAERDHYKDLWTSEMMK